MFLLIKNERAKQYNLLALVICWVHLIIFGILPFTTSNRWLLGISAVSLLVTGIAVTLKNDFDDRPVFVQPFTIMYAWLMLAWLLLDFYWMAPILLLLCILHILSKKKAVVRFSKEEIEYPSTPIKKISWNELTNVVLKDGLLTIDFKNNRIIQSELDPTQVADEAAFNVFAQQRLADNG